MEQDMRAIVDRYGRLVYGIAMAHMKHKEDAEDIFQDVFLTYVRKKPVFSDGTVFVPSPSASTVCRNRMTASEGSPVLMICTPFSGQPEKGVHIILRLWSIFLLFFFFSQQPL